jgi:hypothetical protein
MRRNYWRRAAVCLILALAFITFPASPDDVVVRPVNDGAVNEWTTAANGACGSGSTCASLVNETSGGSCSTTPSDGDTSYIKRIGTGAASQQFTTDLSSIPNGSTITAINVRVCARRTVTQAVSITLGYVVDGGSPVDSGNLTTNQTYTDHDFNSTGLSITKESGTAIELRITKTTTQDRETRLSTMAADITYTLPTPSITSVTPDEFADAATGIVIAGSVFGASQGTGVVELGSSSDHGTATLVEQTVTAWGDTEITFTAVQGALEAGEVFVFVTNDADATSSGFAVTLAATQSAAQVEPTGSVSSATTGATAATSLTLADHEVPSDATLLIVDVSAFRSGNTDAPTGVTWKGTAMTQVAHRVYDSGASKVTVFRLVNPEPGTGNVVITFALTHEIAAGARQFSGVDTDTPLGTAETRGSAGTLTVSIPEGGLGIDAMTWFGSANPSPNSGQVQDWKIHGGSSHQSGGASHKEAVGETTMGWSHQLALIAVAINPSADAPPARRRANTIIARFHR